MTNVFDNRQTIGQTKNQSDQLLCYVRPIIFSTNNICRTRPIDNQHQSLFVIGKQCQSVPSRYVRATLRDEAKPKKRIEYPNKSQIMGVKTIYDTHFQEHPQHYMYYNPAVRLNHSDIEKKTRPPQRAQTDLTESNKIVRYASPTLFGEKLNWKMARPVTPLLVSHRCSHKEEQPSDEAEESSSQLSEREAEGDGGQGEEESSREAAAQKQLHAKSSHNCDWSWRKTFRQEFLKPILPFERYRVVSATRREHMSFATLDKKEDQQEEMPADDKSQLKTLVRDAVIEYFDGSGKNQQHPLVNIPRNGKVEREVWRVVKKNAQDLSHDWSQQGGPAPHTSSPLLRRSKSMGPFYDRWRPLPWQNQQENRRSLDTWLMRANEHEKLIVKNVLNRLNKGKPANEYLRHSLESNTDNSLKPVPSPLRPHYKFQAERRRPTVSYTQRLTAADYQGDNRMFTKLPFSQARHFTICPEWRSENLMVKKIPSHYFY